MGRLPRRAQAGLLHPAHRLGRQGTLRSGRRVRWRPGPPRGVCVPVHRGSVPAQPPVSPLQPAARPLGEPDVRAGPVRRRGPAGAGGVQRVRAGRADAPFPGRPPPRQGAPPPDVPRGRRELPVRLASRGRALHPADAGQHPAEGVRLAQREMRLGRVVRHRGRARRAGGVLGRLALPGERAFRALGVSGPRRQREMAGAQSDQQPGHVLAGPLPERARRAAGGEPAGAAGPGQAVREPLDPPGAAGQGQAHHVQPAAPGGGPAAAVSGPAFPRRAGRGGAGRARLLPAVRDRARAPAGVPAAGRAGARGPDGRPDGAGGALAQAVRDPAAPPARLRLPGRVQAAHRSPGQGPRGLPAFSPGQHPGGPRGLHDARLPRERRRGVLRPVQGHPLPWHGDHANRHAAGDPARGGRVAHPVRPPVPAPAGGPGGLDRRHAPAAGPGGRAARPRVRPPGAGETGRDRQYGGGRRVVVGGGPDGPEQRVLRRGAGLVAGRVGFPGRVPRDGAVRGQRDGVQGLRAGVRPGRGAQRARVPARPAPRRLPGGQPLRGRRPVPRGLVRDADARDQQHALLHEDPAGGRGGLHAPPAHAATHGAVDRVGLHGLELRAALAQPERRARRVPVVALLGRHDPQHAPGDSEDLSREPRGHVQSGPVARGGGGRRLVGPAVPGLLDAVVRILGGLPRRVSLQGPGVPERSLP